MFFLALCPLFLYDSVSWLQVCRVRLRSFVTYCFIRDFALASVSVVILSDFDGSLVFVSGWGCPGVPVKERRRWGYFRRAVWRSSATFPSSIAERIAFRWFSACGQSSVIFLCWKPACSATHLNYSEL